MNTADTNPNSDGREIFTNVCEAKDIGRGFVLVSNPHEQWVARAIDVLAGITAHGGGCEAGFQDVCDAHDRVEYAELVAAGFTIDELVDCGCEEMVPAHVYEAWCDAQ